MLGVMRHLELSRDIHSAYQYSNLCYNVAGLLIERVSGQSYEAFIRARPTDRLGMKVGFSLDDLETSADAARPYMMHQDTRLPAMRLPIRTTAVGAINTSAADLANWMRLHLGKGELDGERLLPAALIDALHVPLVYDFQPSFAELGAAHYGLGFRCQSYRGDRLVFHGSGWPDWGALMTLVPDSGIGVAVLTNRSPSEVLGTLTWYIIDRLRGREHRLERRRETDNASVAIGQEGDGKPVRKQAVRCLWQLEGLIVAVDHGRRHAAPRPVQCSTLFLDRHQAVARSRRHGPQGRAPVAYLYDGLSPARPCRDAFGQGFGQRAPRTMCSCSTAGLPT
jgi:CubicO group peptidase (beta-lactamase class C family)